MAIPGVWTARLKLVLAVLLLMWFRWIKVTINSIVYQDSMESIVCAADILVMLVVFAASTAAVSHLIDISYE